MSDCFWLFVMFLRQVTACEVEHCWYVMNCMTVPDGFGYRLSRSMVCVLLPYRRRGVYCKIRVLLLRYCWYGRLAFNTTVFPATCFCVDVCDSCNPCKATCCIACACFLRIPLFLCPHWIAPASWAFCAPSPFPFWAKKIHRFDALGIRFAHHLPARRGVKTMEVDLPLPACRTISHIYPFTSLFGERDFLYHGLLFKQQHQIMRVEGAYKDKEWQGHHHHHHHHLVHQRHHHHHRHQQHTRTCQNMSKHVKTYRIIQDIRKHNRNNDNNNNSNNSNNSNSNNKQKQKHTKEQTTTSTSTLTQTPTSSTWSLSSSPSPSTHPHQTHAKHAKSCNGPNLIGIKGGEHVPATLFFRHRNHNHIHIVLCPCCQSRCYWRRMCMSTTRCNG